jgi:hypothetical protein
VLLLADALPRLTVSEFRPRASLDVTAQLSKSVRAKLEGFGEALVADRSGAVTDAAIRVREAWMEVAGGRVTCA